MDKTTDSTKNQPGTFCAAWSCSANNEPPVLLSLEEGALREVVCETPKNQTTNVKDGKGSYSLSTIKKANNSCLSKVKARAIHVITEFGNHNMSENPGIMVSLYFLTLAILFMGFSLFNLCFVEGEEGENSFNIFASLSVLSLVLAITGYSYDSVNRILNGRPLKESRGNRSHPPLKNC
ncbi:hypothetical protein [Candidatus Ichthyocystis hellenicum]|uniref:hypothetical protein n=1 Tax=Candidatus Ichthyocystis hellenicum TaxID=1561003 RepID=UPI000B85ACB6|nr:hypothetical protein [Candidatus Ichthyocystis hellenicum]